MTAATSVPPTSPGHDGPVLAVDGLTVEVATRSGPVTVVDDVSLEVRTGELVGVVGESGAGKSMTAWSIMRLVDPPVRIVGGEVVFEGVDLAGLDERALRDIRGGPIGAVVQNPRGGLDPMRRIGQQMVAAQRRHGTLSKRAALHAAGELLATLGLAPWTGILDAYPHELSGGMAQRAMLGLALVNDPRLLVADEPTSGLDATLQLEILEEIESRVRRTGLSVLIVTHELGVVADFCDRVYVMSEGRVVEQGPVAEVLDRPTHEYTRRLVAGATE